WGAGVLNLVLSLSLSHTGHWKFNMAPHGKELSADLKKELLLYIRWLKGWGDQLVSAQTIRRTLHQIGLHGCRPRRKPLLKIMHKKARKQFAEDKQTKDMDYCNHEYKDKCVLPTVKHGGGSVMVWDCMKDILSSEILPKKKLGKHPLELIGTCS
uniref:Transposase Tc1-like domain-containing protein n=1 Tax=Leptobrachium leishanense TaxID=445787 RepID=A0A8C5PJM1_9ANUR